MIGLDPEVFITDRDDHLIPAEAFIPNSAKTNEPAVFDNGAVEIRPAATNCVIALMGNVRETMWKATSYWRLARLRGEVDRQSRFNFAPAVPLDLEHLHQYESLIEFGCAPSLVLEANGNTITHQSYADPGIPWRSAGFHVHSTLHHQDDDSVTTEQVIEGLPPFIEVMDALVGLVDVVMCGEAGWTEQSRIRRLQMGYGLPGEFRVRQRNNYSCIVEYRTLSPWPLSHPIWAYWACYAAKDVFRSGWGRAWVSELAERLPDRAEIVRAITECDTGRALDLWVESAMALESVISTTRTYFSSRSSSLHPKNLALLHQAMTNGGHRYYLDGWSPERAWFRNARRADVNGLYSSPKKHAKNNRYRRSRKRAGGLIVNRPMTGTHDYGARRSFPTGARDVLTSVYGIDKPTPIGGSK